MKPKSLKNTLLLTVAVLVVISGLIISQIVTHRYGVSLIEAAVARAENIAHSLSPPIRSYSMIVSVCKNSWTTK